MIPAGQGLWWCARCDAPADLADPGEPFPKCDRCGHRQLQWRVPVEHTRRLPAEKRRLADFVFKGGLFCRSCEHVTELNDEARCTLCGSDQVERFEPINREEAA